MNPNFQTVAVPFSEMGGSGGYLMVGAKAQCLAMTMLMALVSPVVGQVAAAIPAVFEEIWNQVGQSLDDAMKDVFRGALSQAVDFTPSRGDPLSS